MNRKDFGKLLGELSEELKQAIATAKAELISARATATANTRSIEEKGRTADAKLSEFDQKINDLNTQIGNVQDTLSEVNAIKDVATNPETGIQQDINKINSAKEQVASLRQEISDFRDLSKKYETEISATVEDSKRSKENIEQAERTVEAIKKQIEKIYQLAADTGLAGSFDRRKTQIEGSVKFWRNIFLGSTVSLALVAVIFIFMNVDLKVDELFIVRVLFFTPILGLVFYSSLQYFRERNLLEKYAFKAAMALALESYTELLSQRFKNKYEKEIVDFVLGAMESIYKEPHSEPKKFSYKLGFNHSKFGSVGGEVIEELSEAGAKIEDVKDTLVGKDRNSNGVSS